MELFNDEFKIPEYKFLKNGKDKTLGIVGVSIKEGQEKSGPEICPDFLRQGGLLKIAKSFDWKIEDYGDIKEVDDENHEKNNKDKKYEFDWLNHIHKLGALNKELHDRAKKMGENGQFCLTLGGDHGLATGSISGVKAAFPDLKVIWVDAHADANTPDSSPSGNYHGMPVAHLLGWIKEGTCPGFDWFKPCCSNLDFVFIGLRDLDKQEKQMLKDANIKCFTMHHVLKYGIGEVMKQTYKYLFKDNKTEEIRPHPIHISFDIDGIDPSVAYGTGTKSRGGLLYREAQYIVRETAKTGCLVSFDMVEINPLLDLPREKYHGDNEHITVDSETLALGLEIISSALGEFQDFMQ